MYVRDLIRKRFRGPAEGFHDASGNRIPPERIRTEYLAIRGLVQETPPGEMIGVRLPHDYRFFLGACACMEAGVAYVPMRPDWPEARVEQVRAVAGFSRVIDPVLWEEALRHPRRVVEPDDRPAPDSPLYVMFTSGSSGAPKGVVIPRRAYESFLRWMDSCFSGHSASDRLLITADFAFDVSLADIGLVLLKGCSAYFSRFNGNFFVLADEIARHRITSIQTVPGNAGILFSDAIYPRADLSSLRSFLLGGSQFAHSTYLSLFAKAGPGCSIFNLYGPTETTIYCHGRRLTGDESEEVVDSRVSIGQPLPGRLCHLVRPDGSRIEVPREPGELLISGPGIMLGYLGDPEGTAKALVNIDGQPFYRSGDTAFFDERGNYYVTGRMNETLKRRGYRVSLDDIDAYIQRIDGVQSSLTVALPDPDLDHALVTYIVPSAPVSVPELLERMKQLLLVYQIPDHVELLEALPTLSSGKVARKALEERARASFHRKREP
jgi:D-alanine--poly(phosphoribitol) ligase subunit 1